MARESVLGESILAFLAFVGIQGIARATCLASFPEQSRDDNGRNDNYDPNHEGEIQARRHSQPPLPFLYLQPTRIYHLDSTDYGPDLSIDFLGTSIS